MPNYSIHCIGCDSQRVVMYNAICTWDVSEQKWVYSENYDPQYQCPECGKDSNEIIERENNNA